MRTFCTVECQMTYYRFYFQMLYKHSKLKHMCKYGKNFMESSTFKVYIELTDSSTLKFMKRWTIIQYNVFMIFCAMDLVITSLWNTAKMNKRAAINVCWLVVDKTLFQLDPSLYTIRVIFKIELFAIGF